MANYYTNDDLDLNIARGLVKGVTGLSISGYNATVSTTRVPLWELNSDYRL